MLIDIMREYHSGYGHVNEPFGTRVETLFIAACVALGDLEGKPFCASKVAAYLGVPRTTVNRKLEKLGKAGGLVYRTGRHYRVREQLLNSPSAMQTFDNIKTSWISLFMNCPL
jgi:excisionase family DNA binding protein